jgi:hypothetical protein
MSEYDTWAPVHDARSAHMTEDVAHYVGLAREADGLIVELVRLVRQAAACRRLPRARLRDA